MPIPASAIRTLQTKHPKPIVMDRLVWLQQVVPALAVILTQFIARLGRVTGPNLTVGDLAT